MGCTSISQKDPDLEAIFSQQVHSIPVDTRGGLSTSCWATQLVAISSAKVSTFKAWVNPVNAT